VAEAGIPIWVTGMSHPTL